MTDETKKETESKNQIQEEESISSNVCDLCLHDNLLKSVGIRDCIRCRKPFCVHFCSTLDSTYCVDCMSDVSMTKDRITKITENYNPITDQITRYSQRARQIKFEGQDILFAQRRINTLTDAELDMTLEYHRSMCGLLLLESEERKNAKAHRNANVRVISPTQTTVTTVTKTKETTKSNKANAQLAALLSAMLAKGMTQEQIAAMLKGMQK